MKLSLSAKIARGYLFVIAGFYLLLGLLMTSILLVHGLRLETQVRNVVYLVQNFLFPIFISSLFVLVIPLKVTDFDFFGRTDFTLDFLYNVSPISAVFLGILAIIALIYIRYSVKWLYVWYGLSVLAFAITISNMSINSFWNFSIFGFIKPLLFLGATYILHKGIKY